MDAPSGLGPLNGTSWRAVRFGPGLATTPPPEAEFSLEIIEERLAGRAGCNRYMGGWTIDEDGSLRLGPLATTLMYCDGLMDLEQAYLQALDAVRAATRRDDHLVLTDAGGSPCVELVATAPAGTAEETLPA